MPIKKFGNGAPWGKRGDYEKRNWGFMNFREFQSSSLPPPKSQIN